MNNLHAAKKLANPLKIILLIAIVVAVMGFSFKTYTTHNSIKYFDPHADIVDVALHKQTVEQHLIANEPVRAIELVLYQEKIQGPTRFAMTLVDSDADVQIGYTEQTIDLKDLATTARFEFPDTESFSLTEYYFTLELLDQGKQVFVKATEEDYPEELYVNDLKVKQRLAFEAIYADQLLLGFFLLTSMLLIIALVLLMFPEQFSLKPEQAFVVIALIAGIAMTFISPAGQEPDGGDHILRAFDVSYGNITPIFGRANDNVVQMPINFSEFDDRILEPDVNKGLTHAYHLKNTYFASGEFDVQDYKYDEVYVPMTYYPQGLGFYLGRIMGWNAFNMIALARLLNLLAYILLTYLAIRKMPFQKDLMVAIALIPISIFQGASLSADPIIHGFSFLFVASVMAMATAKKPINLLRLVLPFLLLWVIVFAKPAYIALVLLFLAIPLRNFPKAVQGIIRIGLLVVASVGVAGVLYGFVSGMIHLNEGKPVYETQLDFVLHNLWPTLKIFLYTMDVSMFQYLSWLNILGWINYSLGLLIVAVPLYIVLIGLINQDDQIEWNIWQKLMFWGAFVGGLVAIFVGLYLFDDINSVGATIMLGAQGRYFIPLLILPFLGLRRPLRFERLQHISSRFAGISALILVYTMYTLTRLIY